MNLEKLLNACSVARNYSDPEADVFIEVVFNKKRMRFLASDILFGQKVLILSEEAANDDGLEHLPQMLEQ